MVAMCLQVSRTASHWFGTSSLPFAMISEFPPIATAASLPAMMVPRMVCENAQQSAVSTLSSQLTLTADC
jgi:hypothetical protein